MKSEKLDFYSRDIMILNDTHKFSLKTKLDNIAMTLKKGCYGKYQVTVILKFNSIIQIIFLLTKI